VMLHAVQAVYVQTPMHQVHSGSQEQELFATFALGLLLV
jgi:hypothetical protein